MVVPAATGLPAGLVLAGGRGCRLGGSDKSRIVIAGETLLQRALRVLAPQSDPLLIAAGDDAARFADCGLVALKDALPDGCGPLAGVLAGLDWMAANRPRHRWLLSAPCDAPFLPADFAARLVAASGEADIVIARSAGRTHFATALWRVDLRPSLTAWLDGGGRRVEDFILARSCVKVEWAVDPVDPFFNINMPADLALAESLGKRLSCRH